MQDATAFVSRASKHSQSKNSGMRPRHEEIPMATAPKLPTTTPRWARSPFYFNSAAHLLRVGCEKATTLMELLEAIRTCPESTIFQHTFQTLAEHHFISSGFSNDFSHWAFASCNEVELAERLASIDVREFTSIAALRERLIKSLRVICKRTQGPQHARPWSRSI